MEYNRLKKVNNHRQLEIASSDSHGDLGLVVFLSAEHSRANPISLYGVCFDIDHHPYY